MSLHLTEMRSLVRQGLGGLTEDDISDVEVDRLLNMSLWHLWQKFEFRERECRIYTETVDGTSDYGLPEDTLLDSIRTISCKDGVEADTGQWKKMKLISKDEYDERHNTDEDHRAKPTAYHRLQHTLIVDPVPDDVYTIRIVF